MQSVQISSRASSSSDRAYSTRKATISRSVRSDARVDLLFKSRAVGLVRLYMALKMAGTVFFGLDPSSTWRMLKIDFVPGPSCLATNCLQISTSVSRHSSVSAANKCSNSLLARFRVLKDV